MGDVLTVLNELKRNNGVVTYRLPGKNEG